ncbi:helix-turn-helix transcriptional regulator [Nonomuraea antimicrobica]|uniref:Helix-turn-helix transcriptional regulator n=1 Tax=Nonomuraea antimicrobica TaxID=561173 RepID=A0ABP7DHK1_9ACTN
MYVERPPAPGLAGRITCGWLRTSEVGFTQLVVPDACVDLVWGANGPLVAGPDTGPMPASIRAGEAMAGLRFSPGAVGSFFGVPLDELRDRRVPLSELPGWRALLAQLTSLPVEAIHHGRGAAQAEARLRALEAMAVRRLAADPDGVDTTASAIATALGQGRSVAEAAWALGYSERQLLRRSVTSFGYGPKTLQRIVRFQRALRLARAGRPLAEVAVTAGYADQAHLANDVKRLSGVQMSHLVSPPGAG